MTRNLIKLIFLGSLLVPALSISTIHATSEAQVIAAVVTPPTLKINGFSLFNFYAINQRQNKLNGRNPGYHMGLDLSDLYFTVSGKTAGGIEYKYKIRLEAIPGNPVNVAQNYLEFNGNFGVIRLGDTEGPEETMIADAIDLLGGTTGPEGGYTNVYNVSSGVIKGDKIIGQTSTATKVAYFTPEYRGFRLGFAFTPNTSHRGDGKLQSNNTDGHSGPPGNNTGLYPNKDRAAFGLHNIAAGISFQKSEGPWSIQLTAVGLTEKSYFTNTSGTSEEKIKLKNAKSYQLGGIIGRTMGTGLFQVGAGYLDNLRSRIPTDQYFKIKDVVLDKIYLGNAGHAWNLGASYSFSIYKFAICYQRTDRKTDTSQKASGNFVALTADMVPVQGATFYGEMDFINTKTNADAVALDNRLFDAHESRFKRGVPDNSGMVLILGAKVSF